MPSFKPLIQDGQVEKPQEAAPKVNAPPRAFDMPSFDSSNGEPDKSEAAADPEPVAPPQPQPFPMPDMGPGEISPDLKVRKYGNIKDKIFLPLITEDEDEDPVEAVKRELERMRAQAQAEADEMRAQARRIMDEANAHKKATEEECARMRAEADDILQKANEEAPRIRETAREEGFSSGYKDGEEQGIISGTAKIEALALDLQSVVKKASHIRHDVLAVMRDEITALMEVCLDRMFMTINSVDAGLVARVAREAVKRLDDQERLVVRLNPGNLEQMASLAPTLWQELKNLPNINILADNNLHAGDCVIDTPITQIDATVETRKQRIFGLLEEMGKQYGELDLEQALSEAARRRAAGEAAIADTTSLSPAPAMEQENNAASAAAASGADAGAVANNADDWGEDAWSEAEAGQPAAVVEEAGQENSGPLQGAASDDRGEALPAPAEEKPLSKDDDW